MLDNIYDPNRLKYPMKNVNGNWERITWDQALTEIAEKLIQLKSEFGPSTLGFSAGQSELRIWKWRG